MCMHLPPLSPATNGFTWCTQRQKAGIHGSNTTGFLDSLCLLDGMCYTDVKFAFSIIPLLMVSSGLNIITNDQGGSVHFIIAI